jgi:hypothetical protein
MNTHKLIALAALFVLTSAAHAQGTSFTYRGSLNANSLPATGSYDWRVSIYDSPSGGNQTGLTSDVPGVTSVNGLFSLTLDPGANVFTGAARWMEIAVRTNNAGGFQTLAPRQELTATPYAIHARTAGQVAYADTAGVANSLAAGASISVGTGPVINPEGYSRVLSINGQTSGMFAGTTAVVFSNPVTSGTWSVGATTDGAFRFSPRGAGNKKVVVPILEIVGGSDIAEPFNVSSAIDLKPGMVVSIDPEQTGALKVATQPYDRTVAGIISGAGGVNTGMTLVQDGTAASGKHPVALTGRVYCYVDADSAGPVEPGDLLTTSSTPGHAMRVQDPAQAQGAVLGKAMSSLKSGRGLVLVLVSLQ